MKPIILVAITLCLFACGQEEVDPVDNTVHLAGFTANSSGIGGDTGPACYWKDGVYASLTDDSVFSRVNSLYVDGTSVLMGGWRWVANSIPPGVLWQNGEETPVNGAFGTTTLIASRDNKLFGVWAEGFEGWMFHKNGISQPIIDTASNISPSGIAVLGDDLYVSGSSSYHDGRPESRSEQHAQCWKNGVLIFRENATSHAFSIFIYQNDIYMAGYVYNDASINACYWKNGQRVNLTDENVASIAKSIFVVGSKVYVSGMQNDQAVYWKDGSAIVLTSQGPYSMANSIFVKGTDVHVAGHEHGYPAYWKNDVKQDISNQDRLGQIQFVVVGSN
jgi:hypothetical protein